MTTPSETATEGRVREMGQVFVSMEIENGDDVAYARRGDLAPEAVRKVTVARALVDTGATHLCLPASIIAALGLPLAREVPVATAHGMSTSRVFEAARVTVMGRTSSFDCVELPGGDQPLLGVIVLEALGLQPDIINHRLDLMPDSGPGGYILLY